MIARALAQEPVLLVLDEPTAFLDVPSRVELMGLLRQLTRDRPLAVVVSTHDLELALRTADTIWLVMPGGERDHGRAGRCRAVRGDRTGVRRTPDSFSSGGAQLPPADGKQRRRGGARRRTARRARVQRCSSARATTVAAADAIATRDVRARARCGLAPVDRMTANAAARTSPRWRSVLRGRRSGS